MPRVYKETASNIDKVEFNGRVYRRYPDSPRKHLQRYFSRSGGRGFLHRDVWELYNGPIPAGYQIHHVDGNYLNNRIDNLGCVSKQKHCEAHAESRREFGRSDKQIAHLESIRDKAKAWHSSAEGTAWHSANGKKSWEKREQVELVCQECGATFTALFRDARFCSKRCQNRNWYKAHPEYSAAKNARRKAARLQFKC